MSIATSVKKATRSIEESLTGEKPEMTILDTLKEEHELVADLLKKMADSESGAERKTLLAEVKANLVPHARAEEKVLYDAIIGVRDKKVKKDGEEGYLEHGLADNMLETLSKIANPMTPEFGAAAKVLKELIEHHVEEEERDVWSDAKAHFSGEELKAMNVKYLAAKKKVVVS